MEAFRDAGYRGLPGALSELIDNALDAGAGRVDVVIEDDGTTVKQVTVTDDGSGMTPAVLQLALQFGGTTRHRSQGSLGRYGIGLPGSSISQARRVDVFSWRRPDGVRHASLALDDVLSGAQRG